MKKFDFSIYCISVLMDELSAQVLSPFDCRGLGDLVVAASGFCEKSEKSVTAATQKTECLGLIIDSLELTLSLITQKLDKTHHLCWELYDGRTVSFLELTKLIFLLPSTAQVIFPAKIQFKLLQ